MATAPAWPLAGCIRCGPRLLVRITPRNRRQPPTTPCHTPHQKRAAAADSVRTARANSASSSRDGWDLPRRLQRPRYAGVGPASDDAGAAHQAIGAVADAQGRCLVGAVQQPALLREAWYELSGRGGQPLGRSFPLLPLPPRLWCSSGGAHGRTGECNQTDLPAPAAFCFCGAVGSVILVAAGGDG